MSDELEVGHSQCYELPDSKPFYGAVPDHDPFSFEILDVQEAQSVSLLFCLIHVQID